MQKRRGFTLIELMIVIAIIGILAAIAIPNFRKARDQAREKACYANMRVILGAVEMYNMDNSSMTDTVSMGDVDSSTGKLVSGEYLKRKMSKPTPGCSYSNDGNLTGGGTIKCDCHGTVEG